MLFPVMILAAGVGLAFSVILFSLNRSVRRRLIDLLGSNVPVSGRTSEIIDALDEKMKTMAHRLTQIHPVTGLPTREQLLAGMTSDLSGMGAGVARGRMLGLLQFVQFDQLAAFDREAAHDALACLGGRIAEAVGDQHLLSHIDRATFAIWFRSATGTAEFDAIRYVAAQPIGSGERALTPTLVASTAAAPDGGADPERLLARAIAGLQEARTGEIVRLGPRSTEASRERFRLEQDLAKAIEEDQLTLAFQPVVDLNRGRLMGAEALLRWRHPLLGDVSPARFIPIVEQIGLSDRYGLWVLNAACREAARWRLEGFPQLKMAINLSAQQVLDPDLEAKIDRTLERHGLAPTAIELELTETAAMSSGAKVLELFTRLRAKGLGLAIDDFGTGYSSMSYLRNLPFTKLKIDREFVTGVDGARGSRAICKALIELGRGLGLLVLAEGVETAAEIETLRALGCALFQGFLVSRPLAGDDFIRFARDFPAGGRSGGPPTHHPSMHEFPA